MKLSNLIPSFLKNTQPTVANRPLHCVFYSHIWTVYLLEELGLVNPKTDIILELATESNFTAALNPSKDELRTLLDLLQPNRHLHHTTHHFKDIATPMVLAPATATPLNVLLSALALVNTDVSTIAKAVILVHINDAAQFALAYSQMSHFSIAWDIADYPNANLVSLAELLVKEQHLTEQSWCGMQLCHHKQRQLPDSDERKALLNQLIDEFAFVRAV
jgi:hypothetical protein